MGCQKDIAARIRAKGADYLLALKANHGRAFEAVRGHFERTCFCRGAGGRPACDAFDDSHGRLVRRRVFVSPAVGELEPLHEWPDLRTLLAVETIRSVNGTGKTETEIRYFLTSCNDDPAVLAQAIRRHWSIENACIGFSTSPSVRMTAGCAIAPPPATSPCYAKSPSTSSPPIAAVKPAFAVGAKRPPGTTITCSGSSPARFMREPCRGTNPQRTVRATRQGPDAIVRQTALGIGFAVSLPAAILVETRQATFGTNPQRTVRATRQGPDDIRR